MKKIALVVLLGVLVVPVLAAVPLNREDETSGTVNVEERISSIEVLVKSVKDQRLAFEDQIRSEVTRLQERLDESVAPSVTVLHDDAVGERRGWNPPNNDFVIVDERVTEASVVQITLNAPAKSSAPSSCNAVHLTKGAFTVKCSGISNVPDRSSLNYIVHN